MTISTNIFALSAYDKVGNKTILDLMEFLKQVYRENAKALDYAKTLNKDHKINRYSLYSVVELANFTNSITNQPLGSEVAADFLRGVEKFVEATYLEDKLTGLTV